MGSRAEVTKAYAQTYARASKKVKGQILDDVVRATGWSRDNARRRLTAKAAGRGPVIGRPAARRPRPFKYSYDARKTLQYVWAVSGGLSGKYLAVAMADLLDGLEAHGHLVPGQRRYTAAVRGELLAMSPATIDRYLAPAKQTDPVRGKSTTKPGTLLRTSITIRKAGDEVAAEPGFFEVDTVAHCGPTLKGEFARSVNLTDVVTGWVFTFAIRNNARKHMLAALNAAAAGIPYQVQGLDCDNGSEFINHQVVAWAAGKDIFFTRSRPYRKNDQATVESKNNHLVRRYGFYHRYDSPAELKLLNQLWVLVNDRLNFFTPTKKPIGWTTDAKGRRKRVYDQPTTPLERLLRAGVLSQQQQHDLLQKKARLDPADLAHQIDTIQQQLTRLAGPKTDRLQASLIHPPPHPATGIRLAA
jgi:transposase InsO family protein